MTLIVPPSIDEHALEYLRLKEVFDLAKEDLARYKDELVKLVTKNGATPEGAEKSMRLQGDRYQITVSYGSTSSLDKNVIGKIQAALAEQRTPGLFKDLFLSEVSYIVAPTAQVVLEKCGTKVRNLWAYVVKTKPKEPSLKVERKAARKAGRK